MMTDTKEKLLAAKYFLEQMLKNQSERDAFKYNLGAFLAEARSVTLVMQKEFNKSPGFNKWYANMQDKMQNDPEMKLLNDKRVTTIHRQPVRPSAHINISITERLVIGDSALRVLIHADGNVERSESDPEPKRELESLKNESTIEWRWYFEELQAKDVVTICKEHTNKLETLVQECESRFLS